MRIAFLDLTTWDYTIDTPYRAPLGGSQSALCYLAEQLAALGHDVRLFNSTSQITVSRGVTCAPLAKVSVAAWRDLDALVVQNWAKIGVELRPLLRPDARLILWTQHADDQPAMQTLAQATIRDAYYAFAFVSEWQKRRYAEVYRIDPRRSRVLRNAVGPAFENLFSQSDILKHKNRPPVLAYTSTPFRGLNILLDMFPHIRAAVPDITLQVYSSMQVYHVSTDRDSAQYGQLYAKCRSTPGVEYIGSLPQAQLARELMSVSMLAYPNTFAETSCIAVMEAMASGCHVVTSDLAALPETLSGFGTLIPVDGNWKIYRERFIDTTVTVLQRCVAQPQEFTSQIAHQVAFVNEDCIWRRRAMDWQAWLES